MMVLQSNCQTRSFLGRRTWLIYNIILDNYYIHKKNLYHSICRTNAMFQYHESSLPKRIDYSKSLYLNTIIIMALASFYIFASTTTTTTTLAYAQNATNS